MKCLYWNIRGLANPSSKLALKNLILESKPDLCFIAEPWMNVNKISHRWLSRLGFKLFAVNNRPNTHPNLWCLCSLSLNPTLLAVDDQHISVSVVMDGKSFGISAVYASTCYLQRRNLWNALTQIHSLHMLPWCYLGDFNTILGSHEYRGNSTPARITMTDFQNWIDSNNLIHLQTHGAFFTWANGRRGRRYTQKRLDRVIYDQTWFDSCNSVNVSTLTKSKSDHFPLLFEFKNIDIQHSSSFTFLKMWISHPDCAKVIQNSWNVNVVGCPMYVLSEKLKRLKVELKTWNKNVFGNIHEIVKLARSKVDSIQVLLDTNGPTDLVLEQEKLAQVDLENALHMEELFWHEKSKVKWHCDGDRNTAYFHKIAKIRRATNQISSLRNGEISLNSPDEVNAHIVNHFTTLFNAQTDNNDNGMVDEVIPNLITDRVNNMLTRLPTSEEIKLAVFSLNKDSAPGPDGFGAIFFQTFWDIIKLDMIKAILQFFTSGWIMPNFNSNTLVLIPKLDNADNVNDYTPIAIANFKFKFISKIIADRLASVMPAITSIQQRGFIKGRSIKDCICLTSEAINVLQKRSFGGNLAIKVDIAKAFDTIQWSFLLRVLKAFGFNQKFCQWIHSILQSAKMSIAINGKQHGFFNCSRGVRQGDPSSLLPCRISYQ
jgi:hypothetical protein